MNNDFEKTDELPIINMDNRNIPQRPQAQPQLQRNQMTPANRGQNVPQRPQPSSPAQRNPQYQQEVYTRRPNQQVRPTNPNQQQPGYNQSRPVNQQQYNQQPNYNQQPQQNYNVNPDQQGNYQAQPQPQIIINNQVEQHNVNNGNASGKSMGVALLLCFFLGWCGAHRFYCGWPLSGFCMLLLWITGWFLIIPFFVLALWEVIDFFRICFNAFPVNGGGTV